MTSLEVKIQLSVSFLSLFGFQWTFFECRIQIAECRMNSTGGDDGIRTHDPLLAGQVLSQLSYTPIKGGGTGSSPSAALPFGCLWDCRLSKVLPCVILRTQIQLKMLFLRRRESLPPPLGFEEMILKNWTTKGYLAHQAYLANLGLPI